MGYLTICVFVIACFSIISTVIGKIDYCPEGKVWHDIKFACVPVKKKKKPVVCKYGFEWNDRMKECRRIIYNVKPQDGFFKKIFDKIVHPKKSNTGKKLITRKTTLYTDGWYGYGYNFGRDEPHI